METTSQTLDMVFPPSDVFPVGRVFTVFICMKDSLSSEDSDGIADAL